MKEIIVIASSTWKFAATFPVAICVFQMSFIKTLLLTNAGGLIGIVIFALISKGVIRLIDLYRSDKDQKKKQNKKIFTRKNRRFVRIINNYGFPGIVVLTPVLLSIPVGVYLNTKYYSGKKFSYFYIFLGQIGWSFIYAVFYMKIYSLF